MYASLLPRGKGFIAFYEMDVLFYSNNGRQNGVPRARLRYRHRGCGARQFHQHLAVFPLRSFCTQPVKGGSRGPRLPNKSLSLSLSLSLS